MIMKKIEALYFACGFALGFLIMLLIHVSSNEKRKKLLQRQEAESPKIHVPKYAAGSDIDNIRYHYEEKNDDPHYAWPLILLLVVAVGIIIYGALQAGKNM